MTDSSTLTFFKDETQSRYFVTLNSGEGETELNYTVVDEHTISANRVWTEPTLRGQGLALALLKYVIEDARKHSIRIIPICPYIIAQRKRHPEWDDVILG